MSAAHPNLGERLFVSMTILYAEITKADQRIVEGIASTEALDNQPGEWDGHTYAGDVVDIGAIKDALPDYLKWANVREMHQPSAVGVALKAEVVDGKLMLAVKVEDDDAWNKVVTKVYKGFSIGGRVVKAVLEKLADGTYIRRILQLVLTEISLVDRPANPDAKILLYKREGPMADNPEQETQATGLDAETIAAIKKLAGQSVVASLAKAATDPTKIVSTIQQMRNELELAGDMEGAALLTQAIALVQQAAGEAEPPEGSPEEEATEPPAEAQAEGDQPVAAMTAAAKSGNLKKAGKAISSGRLASLEQTCKTLLQMMAGAGHAKAQKALAAMADMGAGDDVTQAIGAEFTKAVTPIAQAILNVNERLIKIEALPAPGGPQLRVVDKIIAGRSPASNEKPPITALIKAQLDSLSHLARTAGTKDMRAEYQQQYDALKAQYQ